MRGDRVMIKTWVSGSQDVKNELDEAIKEFMTDEFVTIGVHEDEGVHDGAGITNAQLGASLNYGASINHPGGVGYGYQTERDAEAGNVRFLKKGSGFMEIGKTEPHTITIPPRPWLEPGVAAGTKAYLAAIEKGTENGQTLSQILNTIGVIAVASVQDYMTKLRAPANAASTVRKKGSSNPLIDSGELKASVNYKITSKPDEGLE
jgi:hypothetical protein